MRHDPVLLRETLNLLLPAAGETVLDVTLGLGGHALAFAEKVGATGRLIALDADRENLVHAAGRLSVAASSIRCIHANFGDLATLDLPPIDVLFADLGLSSPHVDDPARGFTFRQDGPLDLRFDREKGLPARSWLAQRSEQELTEILRAYGELREARRLARAILESKPQTTLQLLDAVQTVAGFRGRSIAPQVFQAIRIAVNDEVGALERLLEHGRRVLAPGGRMGFLSYHSLEDRVVKQTFRAWTEDRRDPMTGAVEEEASFELLTKKAMKPSAEEVVRNPRSRSAKLRGIRRRQGPRTSS